MNTVLRDIKFCTLAEAQKRELFTDPDRRTLTHDSTSCRYLAEWCKASFPLHTTPGKSTVACIIKAGKGTPIKASQATLYGLLRKTFRQGPVACPRFEKALFLWVGNLALLRQMINGPLNIAQAQCLEDRMNENQDDSYRPTLTLNATLLGIFKLQWSFKSCRMHGESEDASIIAIEPALSQLRR